LDIITDHFVVDVWELVLQLLMDFDEVLRHVVKSIGQRFVDVHQLLSALLDLILQVVVLGHHVLLGLQQFVEQVLLETNGLLFDKLLDALDHTRPDVTVLVRDGDTECLECPSLVQQFHDGC
jgi:hypothetical protein